MNETLIWPIEPIADSPVPFKRLVTRKPFDAGGALDYAAALLLPSEGANATPQDWVLSLPDDACLGQWMGTGFPVLGPQIAPRTTARWVCNFPSTAHFDQAFMESLSEVGLGPEQERKNLKAFKAAGYRVCLTVTPDQPAQEMADLSPDAILVVLRSAADIERTRDGYLGQIHDTLGADIPLILHGGAQAHLPHALAILGVHALLHMPGSV